MAVDTYRQPDCDMNPAEHRKTCQTHEGKVAQYAPIATMAPLAMEKKERVLAVPLQKEKDEAQRVEAAQGNVRKREGSPGW